MADGLAKLVVPGRHTRRPGLAGLRRASLAVLIMLVAQYGLGIFLNLYVAVPASDAHAGLMQGIATAPLALSLHALLGLALIGTAIVLVARAVGAADRRFAVLAAAGLTAIGGAFGAGEIFVRNGQPGASLAMAILTGVALLCYIAVLALASAAQREAARTYLHPAVAAQPGGAAATAQPATAQPAAVVAYPAAWPAAPTADLPVHESWHVASPGRTAAPWFARE